ncbi:hypothetical protein AGMMS50267_03590 [Spirochaetia bacterium]|nr:hypothetical protein AGMMS50267_03590 [Spirochaetia bacterium]
MTTALVFSTAGLIISGFSFLFLFRYLKRRTGQERILSEFRDEVDKLLRQIDEVTDRDLTLVEERIKTLRSLLEDTDRRIAVYAREVDRHRSQEEAFAAYDRSAQPAKGASRLGSAYTRFGVPPAAEVPAESGELLPSASLPPEALPPEPSGTAGSPASAVPDAVSVPPQADAAPPPLAVPQAVPFSAPIPQNPRQFPHIVRSARPIEPKPLPFAERVAKLYRAGFSANLIASQLGAAVSEVELAIALSSRTGE